LTVSIRIKKKPRYLQPITCCILLDSPILATFRPHIYTSIYIPTYLHISPVTQSTSPHNSKVAARKSTREGQERGFIPSLPTTPCLPLPPSLRLLPASLPLQYLRKKNSPQTWRPHTRLRDSKSRHRQNNNSTFGSLPVRQVVAKPPLPSLFTRRMACLISRATL
jgi:hypothetical protein